jgi:alpha-tubulin suppressor-like RCC1 family protein
MKRIALALLVSGCGLHVEALFDLPEGGVLPDGSVEDTAVVTDGFPDDAPVGTGAGIAAGQYHTCAVIAGALFCWGDNPDGALGLGDTTARNQPTRIRLPQAVAQVTAGDDFTCFRNDGGQIFCFGTNDFNELGLGDIERRFTPTLVPLPQGAKQIAAGFEGACAITNDGALYCWGRNNEGQLGQGEWPPVSGARPLRVGMNNDWTKVSPGQGHACGIRAPGSLWCWGRNSDGELGQGDGASAQIRAPVRVGTASDWIDVDSGQNSTCGIRADGSLWCWGVDVGAPETAPAVTSPRRVGTDADWSSVSVDTFNVCARKQNNALYCMGRNVEGALGVGDNVDRASPTRVGVTADFAAVSAGRFHTCAQKTSGVVACAGANDRGQLGVGDLMRRNALTNTK